MSDRRRKPDETPGATIEVDDLYGDQFEDAPATDPTVPPLAELEASLADGEPAVLFAPTLPEMDADIWQAGMEALVSVPERPVVEPAGPGEWRAEAHLYRDESALAGSPDEAAALLVAAGRAALAAGDAAAAARSFDEALARAPSSPEALRARARLAESLGDFDEAHALWARMALASGAPEERAFYAALSSEWTLARRGSLPAVAVDAIPPGPARAIALAEAALRDGAATAAGALAAAGRALGAPREPNAEPAAPPTLSAQIGAAFVEQAARVALTARDASGASAYLAAARRVAPAASGIPLAALGGAARASGREAEKRLAELLPGLPEGSLLTEAVRRWAASLARARGDLAAARGFLEPEPSGLAAALDRLDLDALAGAPLAPGALERARAGAASPAAAATLTWVEAEALRRNNDDAAAIALLAAAIEAAPDATPLALLAEELATRAGDPAARATALETWLRGDDGRRAPAALLLAEARAAAGSELTARAALQTALEAAPTSTVFWDVAGEDARAGRRADASAVLAYGAEIWRGGALEPALRACAAAKLAPSDPVRALAALELADDGKLSPAAAALGAEAVARLAERAGSREALRAALDAAATGPDDPATRAWMALRRASAVPPSDSGSRAIAFEEALQVAPAHPLVLPIYLAEPSVDPASAAAVLARAGRDAAVPTFARVAALASASLHAVSGDHAGALRAAQALLAAAPHDRDARGVALRAAAALGEPRGPAASAALDASTVDPSGDDAHLLAIAEARLGTDQTGTLGGFLEPPATTPLGKAQLRQRGDQTGTLGGFLEPPATTPLGKAQLRQRGDEAGARQAFASLAAGRFAADARRLAARAGAAAPLPPELLAGPGDAEARRAAEVLDELQRAAAGGQWNQVVAKLAEEPPHERTAGPGTLAVAALLAETHDQPELAERLSSGAAWLATAPGGSPATLRDLGQAAATGDGELRHRALTAAIGALGAAESDRRAAAAIWAARARVEEELGDATAAAESRRAALGADPTFLPAARALRITAARGGDVLATAAAAEVEASCLALPQNRVRALLLASALALEAEPPAQARALADLRAALAADPAHEATFERLRSLLTEQGDARALAAALAARIEVAQNPFEVTSLRLARAALLARELGDPEGARGELEAVLRKQPEHPRGLEALSELLWERQEWAEAGEIYLRRAVVERDPATRCRIFLRLGQIYSTQVPDAKRAAAAYERALGVDEQNVEALRALSDLYIREGEIKRALPVTERLVACEPEPARRHRTRVRLGEILIQVGDLARAGTELRRAFDEAPRDVEAVSALVQQLERSRDLAGRRGVLDRALGLLRHDLARPGGLRPDTLRALTTLLSLRERPNAARSAAQLLAAVSGQRGGEVAARRLTALRQPELEERLFPDALPSGIRHLLRVLGPSLSLGGADLAQRLSWHGVARADRRTRGMAPRPPFDVAAAELGVSGFDLYVRGAATAAGPIPLRAEPGDPPSIIIGDGLEALGLPALRFAAGRTLFLAATHLDLLLAVPAEEAGALLVAIVRQFVPDYRHESVRDGLAAAESARVERLFPRKLKQSLMPYAVESAGSFDLAALLAAVRDGANAAGLLACADLPAALLVLLESAGSVTATASGRRDVGGLTLEAIAASPEALALLRFALSDTYDDLAQALES